MKGYSPKLPLALDPRDGFRLTRTLKEVSKQNLKMLVLTSPGERIMDPTFGVGIYNFLFELEGGTTRARIRERISEQVERYMPFIQIVKVSFNDRENFDSGMNSLGIVIRYRVPSLGESDVLQMNIQ